MAWLKMAEPAELSQAEPTNQLMTKMGSAWLMSQLSLAELEHRLDWAVTQIWSSAWARCATPENGQSSRLECAEALMCWHVIFLSTSSSSCWPPPTGPPSMPSSLPLTTQCPTATPQGWQLVVMPRLGSAQLSSAKHGSTKMGRAKPSHS